MGDAKTSKFHVWERNSTLAGEEIKRYVSNLTNTIRRQAQELADLQIMYGTLCLAAKEMGMKEIPLENPRLVQDGMHEFRNRLMVAMTLFEKWDDLGKQQAESILDILYPERHAKEV